MPQYAQKYVYCDALIFHRQNNAKFPFLCAEIIDLEAPVTCSEGGVDLSAQLKASRRMALKSFQGFWESFAAPS